MTHFCYLCFNSVCHLTWHICRKEQKQLQHHPLKKPCGFKRIVTCPNGLKRYHWSNKNGSVIPLSISQQKEVYLCQCFFLWTRSTKNQGVFSMGKKTSNQAARRCRMKSRFNGKPMTPGRCACGNLWRVRLVPRVFPHIIAVHHPTHVCLSVKNWYFVVWRLWKSRSFC